MAICLSQQCFIVLESHTSQMHSVLYGRVTARGGHSFSTYASFSERLTFLTPWYVHSQYSLVFCFTCLRILESMERKRNIGIKWVTYIFLYGTKEKYLELDIFWPSDFFGLFLLIFFFIEKRYTGKKILMQDYLLSFYVLCYLYLWLLYADLWNIIILKPKSPAES